MSALLNLCPISVLFVKFHYLKQKQSEKIKAKSNQIKQSKVKRLFSAVLHKKTFNLTQNSREGSSRRGRNEAVPLSDVCVRKSPRCTPENRAAAPDPACSPSATHAPLQDRDRPAPTGPGAPRWAQNPPVTKQANRSFKIPNLDYAGVNSPTTDSQRRCGVF